MVNKVIIHPFIKMSSGDKEYGEPIETKGMIIHKVGDTANNNGETYNFKNKVIMEDLVNHIITEDDEIELDRIGRVPIQTIGLYNALRPGVELLEVYC